MSRSLYEIDAAIMGCVDPETGEILDTETLTALEIERETKIENVALWVKNLRAEAEALKAEKNSFATRQAAAERKIERLEEWLKTATGCMKLSTVKVAISFRRTESVEAPDANVLPDEYRRIKTTYEADKAKIKEAIKRGEQIPGATLVEKQNISIK